MLFIYNHLNFSSCAFELSYPFKKFINLNECYDFLFALLFMTSSYRNVFSYYFNAHVYILLWHSMICFYSCWLFAWDKCQRNDMFANARKLKHFLSPGRDSSLPHKLLFRDRCFALLKDTMLHSIFVNIFCVVWGRNKNMIFWNALKHIVFAAWNFSENWKLLSVEKEPPGAFLNDTGMCEIQIKKAFREKNFFVRNVCCEASR